MVRIRVATFNILHGLRADGSEEVDMDVLGRSAASLEADVLALQEVDVGVPRSGGIDQASSVAEAAGFVAVFGRATAMGGVGDYGNALLTRRPARDVELIPLPRSSPDHEQRGVILATIDAGGAAVTVAATHLSFHRPEVHDQLEVVAAALEGRAAGGPRVLIGDLNLLPEEVAPVLATVGLELAPGLPTFPRTEPRIRIDHVAVGGGLRLGPEHVVPTDSSDHCALVVEVDVG